MVFRHHGDVGFKQIEVAGVLVGGRLDLEHQGCHFNMQELMLPMLVAIKLA